MKLIDYLKYINIPPTVWAKNSNIAPAVISRFLNGKGISPKNALKVEQATDGRVSRIEILYPDNLDD